MGLQNILDAIAAEGQKEIENIDRQTQDKIQQMMEQAEKEARKNQIQIEETARFNAAHTREQILQKGHTQAQQQIERERYALVSAAIDEVRASLLTARSRSDYPQVLRNLFNEAVEQLCPYLSDGETIQVHLHSADRQRMEEMIATENLKFNLIDDLTTCWGGLVLETQDLCITVNNTLEKRFECASLYLQNQFTSKLEQLLTDPSPS